MAVKSGVSDDRIISGAKTMQPREANNNIIRKPTAIQMDEYTANVTSDVDNGNAADHLDKRNINQIDQKQGSTIRSNSKTFGAKKANLRGNIEGSERTLVDQDGFYNLFESPMDEWNADQWGFFASIMTVTLVVFCCCCCFLLPMCCAGTSCLTDVLMTLLCVELCCDTTPSSGCFC